VARLLRVFGMFVHGITYLLTYLRRCHAAARTTPCLRKKQSKLFLS